MSDPLRILVCGGRDYTDEHTLFTMLDNLVHVRGLSIVSVIHGAAQGADTLAGRWAREEGIEEVRVRADWKTHGKSAGPIRNSEMLKLNPDLVVAFPGGNGTADMVKKARKAGIEVLEVT